MVSLPNINLDEIAFFLDVDGTLLDIAPTPGGVRVQPDIVDGLGRLFKRCDGALALVSGRTLETIDKLFAPLVLPAAGTHGAQVRKSPELPIEHIARPIPAELRRSFTALAGKPGMFIEDKEMTIAIHYRLAEEPSFLAHELADVQAKASNAGFTILHGKKVIELKPTGTDKGAALRAFMSCPPFQGRKPIFAGDDITDSYAFAVLHEFGGIGICIGCEFPGADYCLETPAHLRIWLTGLAEGKAYAPPTVAAARP